jgi:hypothetical protein
MSRNAWEFVETERLTGAACPIDVRDLGPNSIAADNRYHWAYIIYPAKPADG